MKFFATILLGIFIAFIATPTLVVLIKKSSDVSMFYSSTEEEIQKDLKEIKAAFIINEYTFINLPIQFTSKINSENNATHDTVFGDIFIPPPELV